MHKATENMWFFEEYESHCFEAVNQYYYGDISPIFNFNFSSKYLVIVAKTRTMVLTREDGDRRREQGSQ